MPKTRVTNLKRHAEGIITFTRDSSWATFTRDKGWGNGYLGVPKGHPDYGIDYNNIFSARPLDQEWTYSQEENIEVEPDICETFWVFGFDCLHIWNTMENSSEEIVVKTIEDAVAGFISPKPIVIPVEEDQD